MSLVPDLTELPFASAPGDWFTLAKAATGEDALAMIGGRQPEPGTVACLHLRAVEDFARRAGVEVPEAKLAMGEGVFRWWVRQHEDWKPKDGTAFRAELGGAKGGEYVILRRGGYLLLCLAADALPGGTPVPEPSGPPAVAERALREEGGR